MPNRRIGKFTAIGFAVLIVLVVGLLMSSSLRRSSRIVLPDLSKMEEAAAGSGAQGNAALTPITVTPETVQAAISSLSRPERYRRIITVERLWDGGSARSETAVSVYDGWTRTDVTLADGSSRHSITNGVDTYIWYGGSGDYYETAAGTVTADQEQGIPTYEDVLALPPTQISQADYRSLSGVNCIYVETGEDERGYAQRYWVSVDTGLLAAAERLEYGESIYRMGAPALEAIGPAAADFMLPDGTALVNME